MNNIKPRLTNSVNLVSTVLIGASAMPLLADHSMDNRDIAAGKSLYETNCAACHGINLEGQPDWQTPNADGVLPAPPHDATGHTWHHNDELLFDYVKQGGREALAARGLKGFNSGMPGYEALLTDNDIWTILAYIRSTWPDRVQQVQASRNPPHE